MTEVTTSNDGNHSTMLKSCLILLKKTLNNIYKLMLIPKF